MRKKWLFTLFFMSSVSALAAIPGLIPLDDSFNKEESKIQVSNMPAVRTQDGIGLCGAVAAATILEYQYCKATEVSDCSKLPNEKRVSILDLSRFSVDSSKLKDKTNPDDYPREIPVDGTMPAAMVLNAGFLAQSIVPESCAPFDVLVAKADKAAEQDAIEKAMWTNFKKSYEQFQTKNKQCAECALQEATSTAKQWKENYNLKTDNIDMLNAFSAKTYQEFLSQLLIPKSCYDLGKDIRIPKRNVSPQLWPGINKKANYKSTIDKVKSILGSGQPIILSNLCLLEKPTEKCSQDTPQGKINGSHVVVVSGYRKMCNSAGKCYEALRVQNSWGQSWQDQNNDGWVRADQLLDHSSYDLGTLAWLQNEE